MMMRLGKRKREELLSAYLDGELGAQERARLEARLEADPSLRAELDGLRRTVALVRELPPAPLPRNFILSPEMVAESRRGQRSAPRFVTVPRMAFSTLVVGLLFVTVLLGDILTGQWSMAVQVVTVESQVAASPAGTAALSDERAEVPLAAGMPSEEAEGKSASPISTSTAWAEAGEEVEGTVVAPLPSPTPQPVAGPPTGEAPTRFWWRVVEVALGGATLLLAGMSFSQARKEDE